jgi:hypothetical protein
MTTWTDGKGLKIYISCNSYPNHWIQCWCKRWGEENYSVTIETFLGSGARNFLFQNVVPGACKEMYNILGVPVYWDTTYNSGNTVILEPQSGYGLSGVRQRRMIAVKNCSDYFITENVLGVKIEGVRLDI